MRIIFPLIVASFVFILNPIRASAQSIAKIDGFIKNLDNVVLTPANAVDNGDFSVTVRAQVFGEKSTPIGNKIDGKYFSDGHYEIKIPIPNQNKARRVDIDFNATVNGFDTARLNRLAVEDQHINVVLPRSAPTSSCCCERHGLFGRR